MEADGRSEDVIENPGRENKGAKRVTRLSGKRRSVVYRISSDEEEGATSAASASTSQQGRTKKNKGGKSRNGKRKCSAGEETCMDVTKEDEDSEQGNIEKMDGRGKGLVYKLPNKITQENRRNKVDYGLWTAQELKAFATKLTEDIDTARMKCNKLQGVIDGILKDRTMRLKDIIECLVEKVETQGDTNLLQKERMEAITENKRLKKEIGRLEQVKDQKDKEIEGIRSMYEEMEDKYVQLEKIREKEKKFWSRKGRG